MVWNEMMGLVARADDSIPDITDPWATKDVSSLTFQCRVYN
jgi:chitin synthase